MTARELVNNALIEINKLGAPSLLLEDTVYLLNKAVQQYVNKIYNKFDINQQSTDDLRVLQTTTTLTNIISTNIDFIKRTVIELPSDYVHLLNCIVNFKSTSSKINKCGELDGSSLTIGCKRITMDQLPQVINNYYMQPKFNNPYYSLMNTNTSEISPTNIQMDHSISPVLNAGEYRSEKEALDRKSNQSSISLEILFGKNDNYEVESVIISYIKSPMYIILTDEQIDNPFDTSQIIEFPDYVCYEIINEFTKLILENSSDPRLQTYIPINQTIPNNQVTMNGK